LLLLFLLLVSGLLVHPADGAPDAEASIDPKIRHALELTLQRHVKELLKEKDEYGASCKRGAYSRNFRPQEDDTFQVVFHLDTAEKESLRTERMLLTLGKLDEKKDRWEIKAKEVQDIYEALKRSVPGDESFRAFDSFSMDLEGLSFSTGAGALWADSRGGRISRFSLAAGEMDYSYEPPVPRHRALYAKILKEMKSHVTFRPDWITVSCSPDECDRILEEHFEGLEESTSESLPPVLHRAYEDYLEEIHDARKKNAFSGFRRPYEPGDRYIYATVKKKGIDHYLGLQYDSREPREVSFYISGMGAVYRYHSEETRARMLSPVELERRHDYSCRSYEVESLAGTVEMGFGEGELLTGDIAFGLRARRPLKEVEFAIARLTPTGSADREIKNPKIKINSITAGDGSELTWVLAGSSSGLIVLPEQLEPGDRFNLKMQFENHDSIYKFTPTYSYVSRGGWLPFVRYGDMIHEFDLTVKVPKRYKTLGTGKKVSERVEDEARVTRWVGESPVEFPTVIYGKYLEARSKVKATRKDGTEIPVVMHVDRDSMGMWEIAPKALGAVADEAANSLNLYREIFGVDYPYARLDLVNDPMGGLYGQAPSSIVYLGSMSLWSKGVLGSIGGADWTKFVHSLVAHEVGHQWWGSVVSNANDRNYWFVESLAEYASSIYIEATDGVKGYLDHVAGWQREVLASDLQVSVQDAMEMWRGERGGYRAALYAKGPYFFHIMRSTWGDEKFFAFLKNLAQELRGKEIVTRDIQAVAEAAFGQPMEGLFDQWIRGVGIPEYTLDYSVTPVEDGTWIIDGTISQRVVVGDTRYILDGEYFDAVVPVTVLGKESGYKKTLVIRGASTPFTMKVPEEPRKVILNRNGEVLAHDVIVKKG
jgi:hypothetical protein